MTKTKTIFIVLSVAVLVFCGAVGGFEIVRDNGFQKECVADYPQKQTKQCPRCVGTGRCSVCQGRGYFVAISVFMALYPPDRRYSDGSRIWRGMLDNVPCVNVGNTDGSCSRQLQSYD